MLITDTGRECILKKYDDVFLVGGQLDALQSFIKSCWVYFSAAVCSHVAHLGVLVQYLTKKLHCKMQRAQKRILDNIQYPASAKKNPSKQTQDITVWDFPALASFDSTFFTGSYLHSSAACTIHRCSGIVGQAGDIIGEEGQYEALTFISMMQGRATL